MVPEKNEKTKNKGKLILDATCAPADIKYPTDLGILNQARIKTRPLAKIFYGIIRGYFLLIFSFSDGQNI